MATDAFAPGPLSYRELIRPIAHVFRNARGVKVHEPKPRDVYIATYAKSGTVLLQNMLYHMVIQSGGGPEWDRDGTKYTDLNAVVPLIDVSPLSGIKSCESTPRVFATHSPVEEFDVDNKNYRFIYMYRDGHKIPGSFLDFVLPWSNPTVTFSDEYRAQIYHEYVRGAFLRGSGMLLADDIEAMDVSAEKEGSGFEEENPYGALASWFEHIKGWTSKKRDNVLVLQYEKVAKDIEGTARAIADFLGMSISEDGYKKIAAVCDRQFMANDPRLRQMKAPDTLGFGPEGPVRARMDGKGGFRDNKFDEEEEKLFIQNMRDTFGVDDYPSMVEQITRIQTSMGDGESKE